MFSEPKDEQDIKSVLECVELGVVVVVAGNLIIFLDEKMEQ